VNLKIAEEQIEKTGQKRVQDLSQGDLMHIDGFYFSADILYNADPDNKESNWKNFKDWFNKQFSKPKAVECECGGMDSVIPCNCGDGISHYISYVYDEDYDLFMKKQIPIVENRINNKSKWTYKNKELKIITNPWVIIEE